LITTKERPALAAETKRLRAPWLPATEASAGHQAGLSASWFLPQLWLHRSALYVSRDSKRTGSKKPEESFFLPSRVRKARHPISRYTL
jgi:hypothetical protein